MNYSFLACLLSSLLLPTLAAAQQNSAQRNSAQRNSAQRDSVARHATAVSPEAGLLEIEPLETVKWTPVDVQLEATSSYDWWELPVIPTRLAEVRALQPALLLCF